MPIPNPNAKKTSPRGDEKRAGWRKIQWHRGASRAIAALDIFNQSQPMNPDNVVRVMAGTMVLVSLALAHFVNEWWLLLAAFVSVNLIQSAFTGFCPPTLIMSKMGWTKESPSCKRR